MAGHIPWGSTELDTTERLTLSLSDQLMVSWAGTHISQTRIFSDMPMLLDTYLTERHVENDFQASLGTYTVSK